MEGREMRADQIAWYCPTNNSAFGLKRLLGIDAASWIHDTVTAESFFEGLGIATNVAELQFCYDLGGTEIEILRYIEGPHWHLFHEKSAIADGRPFVSHIGFHLDDGEPFPAMEGCPLVQETFTLSHTAAYLTTGPAKGRKYHYRIHKVGPGNYAKFIRRIHPS
jgi:hypothetical protein